MVSHGIVIVLSYLTSTSDPSDLFAISCTRGRWACWRRKLRRTCDSCPGRWKCPKRWCSRWSSPCLRKGHSWDNFPNSQLQSPTDGSSDVGFCIVSSPFCLTKKQESGTKWEPSAWKIEKKSHWLTIHIQTKWFTMNHRKLPFFWSEFSSATLLIFLILHHYASKHSKIFHVCSTSPRVNSPPPSVMLVTWETFQSCGVPHWEIKRIWVEGSPLCHLPVEGYRRTD